MQERFAAPIKQIIEENPSFGYRTVAHFLPRLVIGRSPAYTARRAERGQPVTITR